MIIFNPFPTLRTNRLLLRKLELSDSDLIFQFQSKKENFKYVDMPVYKSHKEAPNYIHRMNKGVENNKWIIWAIADVFTNKILGTITIWNISMNQSKAEVGYVLFPENVGKGIMTEALNKVIEYGFNDMKLKSIEAFTSSLNGRSIALLEKNKFYKVSSFSEETSNGESVEMDIYIIKSTDE
ncbi:GNAT family N-acetyltransferase [Bacillus sp. SM2101]|uniref:GNAT family N-acetyltransferase n=1 Tax=Bacillus sp. SM2101 TaxID=2805366 RepID=UPI001BDEDE27|nr:GNAT family N-acetyltransferase [Bacillus sp. SM2101]